MIFVALAFLAGIGLALVESTLIRSIEIGVIRPDLVVLVVVIATCRLDFGRVMTLAFVLGLTRDFFLTGLIGMTPFSLVLTAYILLVAEGLLLTDNWKAQVFVAFIGSLVFGSAFACLKILIGYEVNSPLGVLVVISGTAAYTAVLAPLGFAFLGGPAASDYLRVKRKYGADDETIYQTEV